MTDYRFWSQLLQPFPLSWGLVFAAVLRVWWRWPGENRRPANQLLVAFLCFSFLTTPLAGYWALRSLDRFYDSVDEGAVFAADANAPLVVLGGYAVRPPKLGELPPPWLGIDSQLRCLRAADLYRKWGRRTVIVTGGKVEADEIGPSLAELMRDFLIEQGVHRDDILLESASRNTHENALFTDEILRREHYDRIFLVTDAAHLPRAAGVFRKLGRGVIPISSAAESDQFRWTWTTMLPSDNGAEDVANAFHEWVGMGVYWWYGWL